MKVIQRNYSVEGPAIEVHGLTKSYPGGVEALKGVDFTVEAGEIFGLLGPNGAGKSTTVGILATTIAPTRGVARLAGFDVATKPLATRAASAVVFQDAVLDQSLSGRRNLVTHARLWGVGRSDIEARIEEVVEAFDLGDFIDRTVATASGGQRRRLEIARALLSRPRVLFLDEPTIGLDPRMRHELLDLIRQIHARTKMTVMLTTHYLDEAEVLCERIAIMHEGRIAALDTPAALKAALGAVLVELRIDGDVAAALATLRRREIADEGAFAVGATVVVPTHGLSGAEAVARISSVGLAIVSIAVRPPTLEDVFFQRTGDRFAA